MVLQKSSISKEVNTLLVRSTKKTKQRWYGGGEGNQLFLSVLANSPKGLFFSL